MNSSTKVPKYRSLRLVANKLAESFVSVNNLQFLKYLTAENRTSIEIDLLKDLTFPVLHKARLMIYQTWFAGELKKFEIPLKEISTVKIITARKPGTIGTYFTTTVQIKVNEEEYKDSAESFYNDSSLR